MFSFQGFSVGALILILVLDLALSVDNAGVNAAIVRSYPKASRNKVLMIGVIAAIVFRIVLIFVAGWLYHVPGLKLVGGIWVFLMAIKMFNVEEEEERIVSNTRSFVMAAILLGWTDLTMSTDNVLALIGAANGDMLLVTIGVIITIPLLFLATKAIVSLIEKYPRLNWIFAGLLGYVGVKMILEDGQSITDFIHWLNVHVSISIASIAGFVIVILFGLYFEFRDKQLARAVKNKAE
nr:YjbE family putative metal transport protein [Bacilli bacterium]